MSHTASAGAIRRLNRSAILKIIRERQNISRIEIAKILHLNPSTVSRLVEELIAMELVSESDGRNQSSSRGGRPSIPLRLNARAGFLAGVDLGGTNMVGALADLSGRIMARHSIPSRSPSGEGGDESLQRLISLIQDLIQACPDRAHIWGIGIGAPAVTLSSQGIVTWAPALGWRNLPLRQIVEARLGIPTFVENDVNLAAMGEHWCGAGQGVDNLVAIFIGTGIGAGIMVNGELYRGASDAAGEVGYIVVDTDSLKHRYDRFGCLESLASGTGIAARAQTRVQAGEETMILTLANGDPQAITAETVFSAARKGDEVATEIVTETVEFLSLAVANVSCVLNPEVVIIGGGVAYSADMLLEGIRQRIEEVVPVVPRIVASALGKDAVLMGAFAMVLQQISEVDWAVP